MIFYLLLISLFGTSVVLFIMCKHTKSKSLVTSLYLQQIREVDAGTKQEYISMIHNIECTYKSNGTKYAC